MSQSRLALPVVAIGASALTFGSQTSDVDAATAAVDLQKVRKDIIDLIEADEKKRGDGTSFAGTFVRLAWHCAGTYAKVRGGGGTRQVEERGVLFLLSPSLTRCI